MPVAVGGKGAFAFLVAIAPVCEGFLPRGCLDGVPDKPYRILQMKVAWPFCDPISIQISKLGMDSSREGMIRFSLGRKGVI